MLSHPQTSAARVQVMKRWSMVSSAPQDSHDGVGEQLLAWRFTRVLRRPPVRRRANTLIFEGRREAQISEEVRSVQPCRESTRYTAREENRVSGP